MDEDRSAAGGHPGGQGNDDADFIEAGEIAAEYEVRRFFSSESAPLVASAAAAGSFDADTLYWYNLLAVAVLAKPIA